MFLQLRRLFTKVKRRIRQPQPTLLSPITSPDNDSLGDLLDYYTETNQSELLLPYSDPLTLSDRFQHSDPLSLPDTFDHVVELPLFTVGLPPTLCDQTDLVLNSDLISQSELFQSTDLFEPARDLTFFFHDLNLSLHNFPDDMDSYMATVHNSTKPTPKSKSLSIGHMSVDMSAIFFGIDDTTEFGNILDTDIQIFKASGDLRLVQNPRFIGLP